MKTSSAIKAILVSALASFIIAGCTVEKPTPDVINTTSPPTIIDKTSPAPNVVVTPGAPSSSTHTETHTSTPPGGAATSTTTTTGG